MILYNLKYNDEEYKEKNEFNCLILKKFWKRY